jgi:hypothetical protein
LHRAIPFYHYVVLTGQQALLPSSFVPICFGFVDRQALEYLILDYESSSDQPDGLRQTTKPVILLPTLFDGSFSAAQPLAA